MRTTQPYRASETRAPSPVLDKMLAGKATPGAGAALMSAIKRAKRPAARVLVPRVGR